MRRDRPPTRVLSTFVTSAGSSDRARLTVGPKSPPRRDIQGLRAIAVLLVVLFHAGAGPRGGYTGVDVFFAISGFVITSSLVAELERTGRIGLGRFYMRRVRRLLPALALMLVVVAALGSVAAPLAAQRTGGMTGIFAALFAGNLYLANLATGYFATATSFNPLLHTWTLGVEEQFYLLFPVVLLAGWWIGSRVGQGKARRRVGAATAVIVVSGVSMLLAIGLVRGVVAGNDGLRFWFYGSPPRAWEFGAGAAAALLLPWLRRLPHAVGLVLGLAGMALILGGSLSLADVAEPSPSRLLAFPVAGACALLVAGAIGDGVPSRLLGIAPLVFVGDISYSWYLWHWPLIVYAKALWPATAAAAPVAAAASLVPAWLSYRYVENPIRYRTALTPRNVAVIAAVCVAVPVAASVGLVAISDSIAKRPWIARWRASQAAHLDETHLLRWSDARAGADPEVHMARAPRPRHGGARRRLQCGPVL